MFSKAVYKENKNEAVDSEKRSCDIILTKKAVYSLSYHLHRFVLYNVKENKSYLNWFFLFGHVKYEHCGKPFKM